MATIQVLIDAKVAGMGEVGALDAEVGKLGSSTSSLGSSLDKTTGELNVAGAAHAATTKEAQLLGASVEKAGGQVTVAGQEHLKAAEATQGLGSQMGQAAVQAKTYGNEAEQLSQKLGTLQGPGGLAGVETAAAGTSSALQTLATVDAEAAQAATQSTDAMQAASVAITDLAAVDGTLIGSKKASTAAVAKEVTELEAAKGAHEEHAEAVLKGVKATGEFGAAGVEAREKLGALAGILGGAGGVSLGLAAFVVGAGAAVEIAKSGTESFLSFGESVLKLQHVTGLSAESSSKLIDVFGQLGIGADATDKAMFNLAHRTEELGGKIPATEKTLQDLGVTVAKNADGSTDLQRTLINVAGAYTAAGSAADKDAIAYAAFGKAGKDLIPVLEQGSVGLQQMSDAATRVFTQEQLEQVHQYNVEMAKAGQEIDKTKDAIGGAIVPVLGNLAKSFNELKEGFDAASKSGETTQKGFGGMGHSGLQAAAAGSQLADASRKSAAAADEEAAATKRLNDQLEAEEQDRQDLLDADNQTVQASLRLQHAAENVASAQKAVADETLKDSQYANKHQAALDKVAVAQANYSAAVKSHGVTSIQAKEAQDKLNAALDASKTLDQQNADAAQAMRSSQLQLKDAMLADSLAARDAAEKQAELSGGHLNAADAASAQAAELEKLKAQAGGVLPAELQTLLDKLNSFHDVGATIHLRLDDQTGGMRSSFGTQIVSAEGGIFTRPTLTWVGESGPEAVVPLKAGNTMPGASPLPDSRAGGGTPSMDDTNELLEAIHSELARMNARLGRPSFATRAYGTP